jgi:hypothetical protein
MSLNLNRSIEKNNFLFFFTLSFFLTFIVFIFTKGFVENDELSDIIFFSLCILSYEIIYLIFSNKIINNKNNNFSFNLSIVIFFIFTFIIWNYETVLSYKNIFLYFIFHSILIVPLLLFIKINNFNYYKFDNYLFFIIISILLSGIFSQIHYSSTQSFLIILFIANIYLLIKILLEKNHKFIDYFLSFLVFLMMFKVFLLSSYKDIFHYSWYLGTINSLNSDNSLLINVVSQYGFLNILTISKLSNFFALNSSHVLVGFTIFLLVIFYYIFYSELIKLVKLPLFIITIFLSFLIFSNIGYNNLSGSILIPSSSVFRFFPSLISIVLFSKLLRDNAKNLINILLFYLSLFISLLWSFESAFFVIFSIGSYLIFFLILNVKKLNSFQIKNLKNKYMFLFGIFFLFTLIILFKDKNIYLFYEHALNTNASLAEGIKNNKVTLFYFFLLILSYIILRDSFAVKKIFLFNILWFALFVSYSAYFLNRSVDNNVFNILPFIFFTIVIMKINSNTINNLRKISIKLIIYLTILSSTFSIINNKEKFLQNILNPNLLVVPQFLSNEYRPHPKILEKIRSYKSIPVTLISGKFIHNPNINLPSYGYGLPILPLEQFNILDISIKQKLMDSYFDKNEKHLLLCINDCNFYKSGTDNDIYNKIFIGKNINIIKINEQNTFRGIEYLYSLEKI